MNYFNYQQQQLYAEQMPVAKIIAEFGSPCYIYSRAALEQQWQAFNTALQGSQHLICYAVKANSNLAVLNILARLGSGFDIVSGGELERVLAAGGDPQKVVFSGVGKTAAEMQRALEVGILSFNIESAAELKRLNSIAKSLNKTAPIAIRVNPDVNAKTHPYIATGLQENKFGVTVTQALELYQQAQQLSHIVIRGIDCHIGSQLTELAPFSAALDKILNVVDQLQQQDIDIHHINVGGGLGVRYHDEQPPEPAEYVQMITQRVGKRAVKLLLEPGRAIAANAGILVTRVEYLKSHQHKNFAIVDAGMNDLLRPALYQAYHEITPVQQSKTNSKVYDVVGPVCETGDFFAKDRSLAIAEGDLLAIHGAGAYGFAMSSNYNSRPRAAEVMVDGAKIYLVRARETIEQLFAHENVLP